MKLTNLYNYGESKALQVSDYCNLDNDPVLSKFENSKEERSELFPLGIYDSAKENNAFHCLVDKLGLAELSIEELGRIANQAQISKYSVIRAHSKTIDVVSAKLNIKINYIIRIDFYWLA